MNIEKDTSIRSLLEWVLNFGVTYLVIVIPRRPILTMHNIKLMMPLLKTQEVIDKQIELTSLFILALRALPDGIRPVISLMIDSPKNEEHIKVCQTNKADMLIVVHPVRPISVEGIMQVTISFSEESINVRPSDASSS